MNRQVADYVKQRQRLKLRAMTKPEDDWQPELFMLRGERMHIEPIPFQWFANRERKAELFNGVIPLLIRVGKVRVVALTVVMYMRPMAQVIAERDEAGVESPTAGLPYFQDVEGSIEQLWVHVFDAERHEGWTAQIKRPAKGAPSLAPFELVGPDSISGALPDPIKEALR